VLGVFGGGVYVSKILSQTLYLKMGKKVGEKAHA